MNRTLTSAAALAAAAMLAAGAPAAQAATKPLPKPKAYANCAALNKVYPHGVATKGARDRVTGGTPVKNFTVDPKTYALNGSRLDRDKDGIACEKR